MSVVDDTKLADWEAMQRLHGHQALKSGDGGGTSGDGMEARLAKLEAQMEHVQADLTKLGPLPADVSALKVAVDNLPTKDYISDKFKTHLHATLAIVGLMITIATVINGFIHH